ncbi:MAG: IS66 family insertion sequence element accessory protein TnpB [Proteobacteria bacterium]|nr:IS66 family insertion sequence element accessory protein TnpB [Pseudomonadota bacterium]
MFFPEGLVQVFVYGQPVNMRLSFDGLYALVRYALGEDPLSGNLFAFINRRGTQMRVLYWDRSGWCIWAKRLEEGRFISDWANVSTRRMDFTGLKLLLEGIEPKRVRKRYKRVGESARNSP